MSQPSASNVLIEMLSGQRDEHRKEMPELNAQADAMQLKEYFASINQRHDFAVGDLVTWKPGMSFKKRPRVGQAAIVAQILESPIERPDKEYGGAYATESLDMVIGVIDSEGDYLEYFADSRRFQPFDK